MDKTLNGFLSYLEACVKNGDIYVWGGQGQLATEAKIKKMESNASNRKRALTKFRNNLKAGYKNMKMFDCSGLGMYWLQNLSKLSASDMTANGMKGKCKKLDKRQLKKGDWVFKCYTNGRAYHIGYVVDDDLNVIEAKGRSWGVIKDKFENGDWNYYGRPSYFAEEIAGKPVEPTPPKPVEPDVPDSVKGWKLSRNLKLSNPTMKGEDVRNCQKALIGLKYDLGKAGADGEFGSKTSAAVKAFQKDKGLHVDGIVGETTCKALKGHWIESWSVARTIKLKTIRMKGNDVKSIQKALMDRGYDLGKAGADGIFGKKSDTAVRAFQKSAKLKVDGIVGKNTVTALGGIWEG